MLRKRWIAIWMALIMLFSCFPVQVFAVGASITSERAENISKTNATFKAVLNNPTGIQPSEVGIYFGETQDSMRPAAKDTYVYNQASLDFWYNANADMGITLKPATTYWYRFYAIINGQTVWGSFKSMQTADQVVQQAQPQAKAQASFGNEKVTDKTETNGTFYSVLYNPTGIQPSEVGCYIGTSADNMKLLGRDTYVYNRSSLEVWYNANAEGIRLEPGTKYYYQFYAVIDGQKVMGDKKSVTTNGMAAMVHTHDWETMVEKAHPHKSVRSCTCGVSEVVNSSNYVSGCITCNPPKVETVQKATLANGTYEISNNSSGKFLNAYAEGSGWKVVTIAGDGSAEQRFTLNGSNGNYTIQTQGYGGRGLYLNGTTLLTGQTGQFCFVNRGNGYTISPANDPSKVLTQTNTAIYGGDHVVTLQNYNGAANQLWTLSQKTTEFVVPITPAVAKASFSELGATNVTQTGAVLKAVLNNPTGIQPAEVGCYIGESKTGLQMGARDTTVYNQNSLSVWYDVNKDMGKALKAGSTYYYQFYVIINGQKVTSDVSSFKTVKMQGVSCAHSDCHYTYDAAHPHREYKICKKCAEKIYMNTYKYIMGCTTCNPDPKMFELETSGDVLKDIENGLLGYGSDLFVTSVDNLNTTIYNSTDVESAKLLLELILEIQDYVDFFYEIGTDGEVDVAALEFVISRITQLAGFIKDPVLKAKVVLALSVLEASVESYIHFYKAASNVSKANEIKYKTYLARLATVEAGIGSVVAKALERAVKDNEKGAYIDSNNLKKAQKAVDDTIDGLYNDIKKEHDNWTMIFNKEYKNALKKAMDLLKEIKKDTDLEELYYSINP